MELRSAKNVASLRFKGGEKCGCLTVIRTLGSKHFERGVAVVFECLCDCGATVQRDRQSLVKSASRYCGPGCRLKLGTAPEGVSRSSLYKRWWAMLERCYSASNKSYPDYGARGIRVCDRWRYGADDLTGFECFAADMGQPGSGMTIERSNSDGHYEPKNCCWANRTVQSRNRRSLRLVTHQGRTQPASAWAEEVGIPYFTLVGRLKRGWTAERAITEPLHPR